MEENYNFHKYCANVDQDWVNDQQQVYNFTQTQPGTLIFDGYDDAESTIHGNFDDVRKWVTDKAKLTADQGGRSYEDGIIK